MIRTLAASFAFILAAACAPAEHPSAPLAEPTASAPAPAEPAPPAPAEPDDCKASTYQALIGKPLTDPAVPPQAQAVRHIRPGDSVTEDYRVERLNIYVTADGVIEKVNCG